MNNQVTVVTTLTTGNEVTATFPTFWAALPRFEFQERHTSVVTVRVVNSDGEVVRQRAGAGRV